MSILLYVVVFLSSLLLLYKKNMEGGGRIKGKDGGDESNYDIL
jgi:hypothetical protein